ELEQLGKRDANHILTDALKAQYERFYSSGEKAVMPRAEMKFWGYQRNAPQIIEELQSFRGQSPLSCGIWDTDGYLKTYDLFYLLTNTQFVVLDERAFFEEVRNQGKDERAFRRQLLYVKVLDY